MLWIAQMAINSNFMVLIPSGKKLLFIVNYLLINLQSHQKIRRSNPQHILQVFVPYYFKKRKFKLSTYENKTDIIISMIC